jgi:hypothetical protein
VNKLLPALCATTHKQRFKRHSEHVELSQRSSKMSCGHDITPLLPQATFGTINEDTGVNLNAKKTGNKCGFCEQRQNHTILNCPNCNRLKERGSEHDMTVEHESLKFKNSIQSSTIISGSYSQKEDGGYYNSIVDTMSWSHCILKEVFHPNDHVNNHGLPWMFDSLFFKVSFLGKNGLGDPSFTNIEITGNAMNQVVTHVPKGVKSKPKYLYDWTQKRTQPFTLSQGSAREIVNDI